MQGDGGRTTDFEMHPPHASQLGATSGSAGQFHHGLACDQGGVGDNAI